MSQKIKINPKTETSPLGLHLARIGYALSELTVVDQLYMTAEIERKCVIISENYEKRTGTE